MESKAVFTKIYVDKRWGTNPKTKKGSSGIGSTLAYSEAFKDFLQQFVNEKNILSTVDVGCGDFQIGSMINWKGSYVGVDCVADIVEDNNKLYGNNSKSFKFGDVCNKDFADSLPHADLYIIKDVLQHLDNDNVKRILNAVVGNKKARYVIICNCCHQTRDDQDTQIGGFRPLHSSKSPLKNYAPKQHLLFRNKEVSVIDLNEHRSGHVGVERQFESEDVSSLVHSKTTKN
jgi:hypothetical protein